MPAVLSCRTESPVDQKELIDEAKAAVERGANHTRHYSAGRRKGDRNRKTERDLSDEWLEVGEKLREINAQGAPDLYSICLLKARYWSDPDR